MPLFTDHIESGLLMTEQGNPVLAMDGGGRWRLEFDRIPRALYGNRVTVRGIREGYDLLYVTAWAKGNGQPPEPSKWRLGEALIWFLMILIGTAMLGSLGHQLWTLVRRLLG